MSQHRWFAVAKYPETCRLRSVHEMDGEQTYVVTIPLPVEAWWIFHEMESGFEKPHSGLLQDGITCCMLYPDKDQHVLACIYTHKPLAGYPRLYEVAPDDLPTEIREGCYYDKDKRLYFPDQRQLGADLQPLYGAMAAAAPGAAPLELILNDLLGEYKHSPLYEEEKDRGSEVPPGG